MRVSDAIPRFLDSIVAVRRPNTLKTYRVALDQFADFVGATPVDQLTAKHINDFVTTLKGHAPATILNRVTALALFYRFAFLNELLDLDSRAREQLTETLKQLRPRFARLPKTIDNDVIASLIVAIEQTPPLPSTATPGENKRHTLRQLRDRAIVLALQWSGMRVGELVALRRADLDWGKHTAKVTGKNDSQRIVYFDPSAWHAIKTYLSQRADGATGRALGSLPVFARHDSRAGDKILPLTTKSVQEMFAVLGKRIGLPFPVTPHVLRHSFARNLLESSGNLAVVQDALGHQSPETTRIYVPLSEKRVRDAVRNMYREEEE